MLIEEDCSREGFFFANNGNYAALAALNELGFNFDLLQRVLKLKGV